MGHTSRRSIPGDGGQNFASQALAQFLVAVAGEEFPQILSGQSLLKIALQKTLNRVRNFTRQTPVADWTSNRLMQTDCTADAEVVGILEPSSDFNFLAFNPNVCDPVLPAAVRAAGDVKLEVLLESGQAFFKLFHQPASKTLRFGNGQLAEFRPAAGDCATPKWRGPHSQTDSFQSLRQLLHIAIGDIHDEQILHVRRAQFAASKLFGEIGGPPHLFSRDSAAQHSSAHIRVPRLFLRMNAYVIAINIIWPLLRNRR